MRISFIHSLLNYDILSSPKLSVRFYSRNQNVKSSKNHYDTLKITPNATYNEIKSAYYKLTLQYHPDKNKSEYAKEKFHDISEAYEILGNYESRKNYDQHMRIHKPVQPSVTSTTARYNTVYKKKVHHGPTSMYNFDAWIKAHYEWQMDITNVMKKRRQQMMTLKRENTESKIGSILEIVFLIIIFIIAIPIHQNLDRQKNNTIRIKGDNGSNWFIIFN